MTRLRALGGLVLLGAFEVGAWLALRSAGHVQRWRVDYSHLWRWLGQAPPLDAAAGLARVVALALVGWLCLSTAAYLLASLTRVPALIRLTGAFTLPAVRRVVRGAAGVGLAVALVGPAGAALAHEAGPAGGWQNAPAAAAAASQPVPQAGGVAPVAAVAPSPTEAGRWPVYEGDNLWTAAEATVARVLGSDTVRAADVAPYWNDLCEHVAPGLASGDVNLIYPGEKLELPPAVVVDGVVRAATHVAAPASSPTPVAAPAPAVAPAPAPPAPAVTAVPTTAAVSVTVPAPPTTGQEAPSGAEAPDITPAVPEPTLAPPRASAPAQASTTHGMPFVTQLGGGGLLCFGIAALLARLRRSRSRRRPVDCEFPPLTPSQETTELAVLVGADHEGAAFLEAGLRAFCAVVGTEDLFGSVDLPTPLGVVLHPDRMEIVLAEAAPALAPFTGAGERWMLDRPDDLSELVRLGDGAPVPSPALVSLGRLGDAEVLVDLEDPGLCSVEGDPAAAAEVVIAAGLALATSPWSEPCSVVLVGFDSPPELEHVTAVDELTDEVFEALEDEAERVAGRLHAAGMGTTCEARVRRQVPDAWRPTVVVCARPLDPDRAARLVGLVNDAASAGLGALVVGPVADAPWVLPLGPDGLVIDAMGVTVAPLRVNAPLAADVSGLLASAVAPPVPARRSPVVERAPGSPEVLVRVLGPVTVEGLAAGDRAKAAEALVYLAVNAHRQVDSDRLVTALWPDSHVDQARGNLGNTLWRLRQRLGCASDGSQHFPALKGKEYLYRLGPFVGCDLCLVEAALEDARRSSSPEVIEALHSALALVRGTPFDHVGRGFEWAHSEGVAARAVRAVGDAAHRLSELYLTAPIPDPEKGEWAARQGLLAEQGNEVLLRDVMRCRAAMGQRAGLVAVRDEVLAAAEADDVEVDPATDALYRELLSQVG